MSGKQLEPQDEDAKRLYQQAVLQQSLEFDKQLIWLAGGAIGLVLALTTTLKPRMDTWLMWVLGLGLLLLLGSLIVTLASFQVSIADAGHILHLMTQGEGTEDERVRREKRMRRLNIVSLAAFALGVLTFVLFALLVLGQVGVKRQQVVGVSPTGTTSAAGATSTAPAKP